MESRPELEIEAKILQGRFYIRGGDPVEFKVALDLLMQGTRVRALVWEDPTCRGATGPVSHSY